MKPFLSIPLPRFRGRLGVNLRVHLSNLNLNPNYCVPTKHLMSYIPLTYNHMRNLKKGTLIQGETLTSGDKYIPEETRQVMPLK